MEERDEARKEGRKILVEWTEADVIRGKKGKERKKEMSCS